MIHSFSNWHELHELQKIVDGFKNDWGIPQCGGSIDGTHIPITAPVMNHTDYYNRKGSYFSNCSLVWM